MTVITPLQKLTIQEASATQGHTLSVPDERKQASRQNACQAAGINFVPLWRMEPRGSGTIKLIGRLQGQRLGLSILETTAHLFRWLAIELWNGNACM